MVVESWVAVPSGRPGRCRRRSGRGLRFVLLPLLLATACTSTGPSYTPTPGAVFFTGAGDIGECGARGADSTAVLLDRIPGLIWTTGDNAYPAGSARDFERCFHPTWGRHRDRIRPTPGNHEYWTAGAAPYFEYFGEAAGTPGEGWYTYEYGGWRVVALNSNLDAGPRSPQLRWLRSTLAADTSPCTVAYFHHPIASSGAHGDNGGRRYGGEVRSIWAALYQARAELVLVGHDHHYERFAPMTPAGAVDRDRGVRQFIAGTGGGALRGRGRDPSLHPASELFLEGAHGVLKLELRRDGYAWEFVDVAGRVRDRGSDRCR